MKIKIDQIRTYDDAGYRRRAACLCVRSDCESEVLLVSSSRCKNLWIVPGGGLEPGEDPATTAVREVDEEAGAVGRLGRLLDVFENKERKTRTYVYVLMVEHLKDEYDDAKGIGRDRKWFSLSEATMRLREHKPVQTAYLEKLIQDKEHIQKSYTCGYARMQNSSTELLRLTQLSLATIGGGQQRNDGDENCEICEGCSRWRNNNKSNDASNVTTYEESKNGDNNNIIICTTTPCIQTSILSS